MNEPHLTLSVLQWDVQLGQPEQNLKQAEQLVKRAAAVGSQLVVLPELCNSGYAFDSKEQVLALAEPPEGPTEQVWLQWAKKYDIAIAGGLAEKRGSLLYNSLVFITPQGIMSRYHKTHLFDREKLFFSPGKQMGLVVWKGIKVGLMLCYDGWFPEYPRALTLAGAEVILAPGCWHQRPPLHETSIPATILHLATAYTNSIFVACASRTGTENGAVFEGSSAIMGPKGMLIGPASQTDEAILTTSIDLRQARFKYRTKRVHSIHDRRPDLYTALTLPNQKK